MTALSLWLVLSLWLALLLRVVLGLHMICRVDGFPRCSNTLTQTELTARRVTRAELIIVSISDTSITSLLLIIIIKLVCYHLNNVIITICIIVDIILDMMLLKLSFILVPCTRTDH